MIIDLWDDQKRLFDKIVDEMRKGNKRILVRAETGAGKTVIAAYMIQRANSRNNRCAFDVPRKTLMHQTALTFRDFGIDYSYVASGKFFDENSSNWITSTQTWCKRLEQIDPDIIIIDEAHYGAKQRDAIIQHYTERGKYIIGLSATPEKENGQPMSDWYDVMVEGEDLRWLIDHKRLSDYKIFVPHTVSVEGLRVSNGEYSKKDVDHLINADKALVGNVVETYKKYTYGSRHMTFCQNIKASKQMNETYNALGVASAHLDGDTPDGQRNEIIEQFADGKILNLCTVDLCLFGFDLSAQIGRNCPVESMSDARISRSRNTQRQKWGRVLRYKDSPALIFDHVGNALPERHGLPCDEQEWSLQGKKRRKKTQEQIDSNRMCDNCFYVHKSSPACPNCGYVYPKKTQSEIDRIEGELVELERQRERRQKRIEEGMCRTLDDWMQLADERGYKKTWAFKRHALRDKRSQTDS